jgi:hypothetical protein
MTPHTFAVPTRPARLVPLQTAVLAGCPDSSGAAQQCGRARSAAAPPCPAGSSRPAAEPHSSGPQNLGPLPEETSTTVDPCIGPARGWHATGAQTGWETGPVAAWLGGPVPEHVGRTEEGRRARVGGESKEMER